MPSSDNMLSRAFRVALVTLLAGSGYATAQHAPDVGSAQLGSVQQGRWKAVYLAGAGPFGMGSRVQVTLAEDQLVFTGKKGVQFSIPASTVTALSSNLTSEHTATRNQMAAWGGLAQFSPYMLMFLPFGIPVMAATYPIKSKYAYISVLWSEKGADEEVQFRLDRKDYEPFLAQLRKSTGKEWKNLEGEWERLKQALANGTAHQALLRLDRKVRIGQVDVRPGPYQLIILKETSNQGQAYLFSNNEVDIEHLISTSHIEMAESSEGSQSEAVRFKQDDNGVNRISEIRTSGRVLRFP